MSLLPDLHSVRDDGYCVRVCRVTNDCISELISNAADALEKLRHMQTTDPSYDSGKPLEIRITVDRDKKLFVIQVPLPE